MNRTTRLLTSIATVALLAVACSGSDDEAAEAPAPTEAPPTTAADAEGEAEPAETTVAPTTTAAPTTTEATTTTTEATTTTTSTTTTEAPDTEAPPAPTGLACGPGGGSGEVTLWWDAPADPSDIDTIQIYVNENGAGFVRLHTYTQDQLLNGDPGEWMANVVPVAYTTPIQLAVTYDDAAGNESGWNPIDAWVPFAGAGCNTGAPDTPTLVSATRGGGSGEVDLRVDVSASDVVSWVVEIDQGGGFVAGDILLTQSVSLGEYVVTLQNVDHTLPAEYRVRAVDAHGNASGWGTRSCPVPISPGDVAC